MDDGGKEKVAGDRADAPPARISGLGLGPELYDEEKYHLDDEYEADSGDHQENALTDIGIIREIE